MIELFHTMIEHEQAYYGKMAYVMYFVWYKETSTYCHVYLSLVKRTMTLKHCHTRVSN